VALRSSTLEKISGYVQIEGAEVLIGHERPSLNGRPGHFRDAFARLPGQGGVTAQPAGLLCSSCEATLLITSK
jgi:hypothetical protein